MKGTYINIEKSFFTNNIIEENSENYKLSSDYRVKEGGLVFLMDNKETSFQEVNFNCSKSYFTGGAISIYN